MAVRRVPVARAYGFALVSFLVAALIRLGIDPWLGKSVPFNRGSIAARSDGEGSGATFIVRLPLPGR